MIYHYCTSSAFGLQGCIFLPLQYPCLGPCTSLALFARPTRAVRLGSGKGTRSMTHLLVSSWFRRQFDCSPNKRGVVKKQQTCNIDDVIIKTMYNKLSHHNHLGHRKCIVRNAPHKKSIHAGSGGQNGQKAWFESQGLFASSVPACPGVRPRGPAPGPSVKLLVGRETSRTSSFQCTSSHPHPFPCSHTCPAMPSSMHTLMIWIKMRADSGMLTWFLRNMGPRSLVFLARCHSQRPWCRSQLATMDSAHVLVPPKQAAPTITEYDIPDFIPWYPHYFPISFWFNPLCHRNGFHIRSPLQGAHA